MTNPFIPKFVKNMIQSSPMQEAFWHRLAHKNEAQVYDDEASTSSNFVHNWTDDDFKNYGKFRSKMEEIESGLEAESQGNALRRYQIALEHASKFGEIVSFEYNDKEGSSTVVYKTEDE
jgi:hypothetical protein